MEKHKPIPVNSLATLRAEMGRVKETIAAREASLVQRANRLPGETLKAGAAAILPAVIGGGMASGLWKLGKGIFELLVKNKGEDGKESPWKESLIGGAKKMGIVGVAKLLFSLWRGK
jgi:hypothetical protein